MLIRILYIERENGNCWSDQDYLKSLGFRIYPSRTEWAEAMIGEVKPDLCCIQGTGDLDSGLRRALVALPRIYDLMEDELYWVERPAKGSPEVSLCDNLLDGIRLAMGLNLRNSVRDTSSSEWIPTRLDRDKHFDAFSSGRKSA